MPRIGLVGKFALASAIPMGLLGVALAIMLGSSIRDRALERAADNAALVARLGIQPYLEPSDFRGMSSEREAMVSRVLASDVVGREVARINVWGQDRRVVFSTEPELVGLVFPASEELDEALAGHRASELTKPEAGAGSDDASLAAYGRLLEVYVPLRFAGEAAPAGAFELYLPYGPIAAAIDTDRKRLYFGLLAGLGLLWAGLFPIVGTASRRLRRQAAENRHQALHDALTDLPNRALFRDRVEHAIDAARREGLVVAVLIMDLDRFKEVNDTLGHHSGDLLLKELAGRLRAATRAGDTVARLGGDEFGILLPRQPDRGGAEVAARRMRAVLDEPFVLEGVTLYSEASVGIALSPEHGADVDTLLQRADVAMYVAKESHTALEVYAPDHDQYSPSRLALAGELRQAIEKGELRLHYQPKADLRTGQIGGVEALVRWQHPKRGLIPPAEFVPLAERTGLIRPLTHWVLEAAIAQCRAWLDDGLRLTVAVNVSSRDLLDHTLPDEIERMLARRKLPAGHLELELTESTIMTDPMRARAIATRLSAMGVRLAIDDFGSGYSSIAYLKRLPVDAIKIDRSLVTHMTDDPSDAVVVRSTIELVRGLGLQVVAEGVETEATWRELASLGCNVAQGYYLGKPMPAAELRKWLGILRKAGGTQAGEGERGHTLQNA